MQSSSKLQIFYVVLALMVAQAHCQQLTCYICENCAQITENTPKETCDESFFNKVETTQPPATTKETTVTTASSSSSSATTETTEPPTSTTTTDNTTVDTTTTTAESTSSTKPPIPTASTVGPPQTTTALPTPPTPGSVAGPIDAVAVEFNQTATDIRTTTPLIPTTTLTAETSTNAFAETTFLKPVDVVMQPAQLRVRMLRSAEYQPFTYHCFTVQQSVNGSKTTSRGCSRINQTEAVCPTLELISNTKFTQCTPCSNAFCNGSGAIGVSAVAVILGLVCALLLGFPA